MIARFTGLGSIALSLLFATSAYADPRAYRGAHPLDLDGHWHFEDEIHVHDDLAVGLEPFGDVDGALVFLGDPVAYGYGDQVWAFRGAHPLAGGLDAYCGIAGEHLHHFAPEGGAYRRDASDVYSFAGAMRGGQAMVRPGRTAPRNSVARVELAPAYVVDGVAPFFFGGCLHDGCSPRREARPAPPPRQRNYFDGNYTRLRSHPARLTPRGSGMSQRDR